LFPGVGSRHFLLFPVSCLVSTWEETTVMIYSEAYTLLW
jgi:hypothetical protein